MGVTIEWIHQNSTAKVGILRFGDKHFKYGDPYEFSCAVKVESNIAHFYGGVADRNIVNFLKYRNEIQNILVNESVKTVIWEGVRNNKKKVYRVDLGRSNKISLILKNVK